MQIAKYEAAMLNRRYPRTLRRRQWVEGDDVPPIQLAKAYRAECQQLADHNIKLLDTVEAQRKRISAALERKSL